MEIRNVLTPTSTSTSAHHITLSNRVQKYIPQFAHSKVNLLLQMLAHSLLRHHTRNSYTQSVYRHGIYIFAIRHPMRQNVWNVKYYIGDVRDCDWKHHYNRMCLCVCVCLFGKDTHEINEILCIYTPKWMPNFRGRTSFLKWYIMNKTTITHTLNMWNGESL